MIINTMIRFKKTSCTGSRGNLLKFLQMVLALIVIVWMNNGLFAYAVPYIPNFIRYGLYFVWLGLAVVANNIFVKTLIIQAWPLLLFYFYVIFISFFANTSLVFYIKSISYLLMVYTIFLYYFNDKDRRFQKYLCNFLILDCIAVGVNTYLQLQKNPLLTRYLSTGENTEFFPGVGSYSYFYPLVSIILLLTFLFLNQPKRKLSLLLAIVAAITLLIQSTFTIAIICVFIFILLMFIMRYSNKYVFVFIAISVIILFLMFQGIFASLFMRLADIQGIPYEVSVRFLEITDIFSGYSISGTDLNSRQGLYLQSVDAFANNILIGTVANNSNLYSAGGHSAWFDLLATFGLFSIPFFMFLYKSYKYCKNKIPAYFLPFVNVYWLYYICLGFINTILFSSIFTIWFLFLPVFINAYFKEENYDSDIV